MRVKILKFKSNKKGKNDFFNQVKKYCVIKKKVIHFLVVVFPHSWISIICQANNLWCKITE